MKKNTLAAHIAEHSDLHDIDADLRAQMTDVQDWDAAEYKAFIDSFKWTLGRTMTIVKPIEDSEALEDKAAVGQFLMESDDGKYILLRLALVKPDKHALEKAKTDDVDIAREATAQWLWVNKDKLKGFKQAVNKRTNGDLCVKYGVRNPLALSWKDAVRYWLKYPVEVNFDFYTDKNGKQSQYPTIQYWFPEDFVNNRPEHGGNWISL